MSNTQKNIPELRFPRFEDEWEENVLGEVVDVYDGTHQTPKYTNEGIKFLSVENIKTLDSDKYISKEAFEKEFKIRPEFGDILMTRIGNIGTPNIVKSNEDFAYYVSLALLKPKCINSYFLKTLILSPFIQNELWRKTLHVAFPKKINKNEIAKVMVNYPNKKEQEKIGDFFSKLDQQIELEEQKLSLLEEQKKGYMQKLFSQELRFKTKDDVYYSEWQLHKLGEIFKYSQGQQISVDKQFTVKNNEMKRFIRIVDITENPEPRFVLYESDTGLVNKGDLFMIRYGRPGIVSIGFEGIIANNLFKLIPKIKISTVYFYYLLSYNYYRINLLTNQSTMPALNFKSLDLLKFKIPSYKEQNKIGNFFTKFDELIEKQNKKIDGLKERKKGFLQKMFV